MRFYVYLDFPSILFSGIHNVIVNINTFGNRLRIYLMAKPPSRPTPGILCEKGNFVFTSVSKRTNKCEEQYSMFGEKNYQ